MFFRQLDQLAELVNDPQRPVQFIFAGKAHPADEPGKQLIKKIANLRHDRAVRRPRWCSSRTTTSTCRHLVQGVDVWLNNPRRPLEASGTSGMKAVLNGGLNCSMLDGWWAEAYNGKNGFAIGNGTAARRRRDHRRPRRARTCSACCEDEVIPLFYDRDADGLPRQWIELMIELDRHAGLAVQRPSHGDGLRAEVLPGRRRRPELGNDRAVASARAVGCQPSAFSIQPELSAREPNRMPPRVVTSPDDPALAELCRELAERAAALDASGAWPAEQLRLCGEYGVYEWFAGREWGGQAWDAEGIIRGYLALSSACLTTTFIITQREGACRRIEGVRQRVAQAGAAAGTDARRAVRDGRAFRTSRPAGGMSSGRCCGRRRLRAATVLDGFSAWVTGAPHADYVLIGRHGDGRRPRDAGADSGRRADGSRGRAGGGAGGAGGALGQPHRAVHA